MKYLLFFLAFLFSVSSSNGQNSIGLRLGFLSNKIHDCYSGDKRLPAALGAYGFFLWRIHSDWGLQFELGYSERKTHVTQSGVSHRFSSDFRLKQLEMNVLGKFEFANTQPKISLEFGLATGFALSGREYIAGGSVGPVSVNEYRDVDFSNFRLKRFQVGPLFGLEIAQSLFGIGDVVFDARFAYYPENDFGICDDLNETRLSLSIGYRWNLKRGTK